MKFIESQVVGSGGASSVTIGSGGTIPQTYSHLILYVSVASTGGTHFDSLRLKFNNDATTNAYLTRILYGTTGGWAQTSQQTTSAFISDGAGSTSGIGKFGASCILIPNYASTSLKKQFFGYSTSAADNANIYNEPISGLWDNTSAITSLVFSTSGNIKEYSRFDLYGLE